VNRKVEIVYDPDIVLKRLDETGYRLPNKPSDEEEPFIPDNMDLMPPQQLREIHAKFAAWLSYLNGYMANSIAIVSMLKETRTAVEAALLGELPRGKNDRLKEIQSAITLDPRYVTINKRLVEEEAFLSALKSRISRLEMDLQAISRQITIALGYTDG